MNKVVILLALAILLVAPPCLMDKDVVISESGEVRVDANDGRRQSNLEGRDKQIPDMPEVQYQLEHKVVADGDDDEDADGPLDGGDADELPDGGDGDRQPDGGDGDRQPDGGDGDRQPDGGDGDRQPDGGDGDRQPDGGDGDRLVDAEEKTEEEDEEERIEEEDEEERIEEEDEEERIEQERAKDELEARYGDYVTVAKFVETDGRAKECHSHEDCYDQREPESWCILKDGQSWTDKGCFCAANLKSCVFERRNRGTLEYSYCAPQKNWQCSYDAFYN